MDKVRVSVEGVDVGYYDAAEIGLAITWQNKAIDEVNSFRVTFTKTMTLPLTKELSLALGHPQEIDSVDFVSLKTRHAIDVFVNETLSVCGWIKPIRTVLVGDNERIEFSVNPRQKLWVEELAALELTDLDLSDQDHTLTVTEIRDSETYDINRMYVYPPIDIAEVSRLPVLWVEMSGTDIDYYYLGEQISTSTFSAHAYAFENTDLNLYWQAFTNVVSATWNARNIYIARTQGTAFQSTKRYDQKGYLYVRGFNWQVGDFYPCSRIKDILARCGTAIGWTFNIENSSAYLDDKFHFQHNVEILNKFEEPRNYFKVKVTAGTYNETITVASKTYIMPFMNTTEAGYVPNPSYTDTNSDNPTNILNGTNVSRFTATETSIMRFKWYYDFLISYSGAITDFVYLDLYIEHYNSANVLLRYVVADSLPAYPYKRSSNTVGFRSTINTGFVYMQTGDYIVCKVRTAAPNNLDLTIYDTNVLESVMYEGGNFRNKSIRLNEYLPEVTALEWLKDISLIHNLQFYTNEQHKTVYIVRDDDKRTGKKIDFTERIDRSKEIELEDICGLHPKTYNFNWNKDQNDWSIDFIEIATGERFAKGVLTNLNDYVTEVKEISTNIYAATLDKFEVTNIMYFNTVEMKGKETWKSLPTWKRVDYLPRYLTLTFGETLEDNGLPYEGTEYTGIVYSIEGDGIPTTYVRPEFQLDLHWGSTTTGLLKDYYTMFSRRMNYGQIVRAYLVVNEKDVDRIATILEEDNDFRADYDIQIKANVATSELNKIIDYSPANQQDTRIEFIILKDEI